MSEKYDQNLDKEREQFEEELNEKLEKEETLEAQYGELKQRRVKKRKKHIPHGGTLGAEQKKLKAERFRIRTGKKPEIRIIDKTKK